MELPGVTAIDLPCGTLGDEKELEFVSAVHQTDVKVRTTGTISSADIKVVLMSRYGFEITEEVARDLAYNLCAAKEGPPEEEETDKKSDSEKDDNKEANDPEDNAEPKPESPPEVYFDIVQLLALILIPEIKEMSTENDGVCKAVLNQILEPLDDIEVEKLNETGEASDAFIRQLLIGVGDIDSAQDDDIIRQMSDMVKQYGTLDAKTLAKIVVADLTRDLTCRVKESTFHDVFGHNFDEKYVKDIDSLTHHDTDAFVDYANSGYRSGPYNSAVWILSISVLLFFWMFVGSPFISGKISSDGCNSFGCTVANKLINWLITGVVVGIGGTSMVLLMNFGNIGGNKHKRTLFSLIGTIAIILSLYVPTFIYESNIPHDTTVVDEYRNIVPKGPFVKSLSQKNGQIVLKFDFKCRRAKDFCNVHRELQGIQYPANPTKLTYEEMNTCLTIANETEIYSHAQYCVNETCVVPNIPSKEPKCVVDDDCIIFDHLGVCGRKEDTNTSDYVCCPSGRKIETSNGQVCSNQPLNSPCVVDGICDSKKCGNGFCESDTTRTKKSVGGACNNDNNCTSDFCNPYGVCDTEPVICPAFVDKVSITAADAIIAPRNVSEDEFCLLNAEIDLITESNCSVVIDEFENAGFITVVNKTEENLIRTITPNYNILEDALRNDFSVIILYVSLPIGFVVIAYQLFLYFRGDNLRHRSYDLKCAAKVKLESLITNAMKLRQNILDDKVEGEVMRNYLLQREVTEPIASLPWTFEALYSRSLMVKYGIHIPARLYTALGLQAIILIAFTFSTFVFVNNAANNLDNFLDEKRLSRNLGLDIVEWTKQGIHSQPQQKDDLVDRLPRGWMLRASFYPGAFIGLVLGLSTLFVLIPSFVASVVRFRKGRIPSLADDNFNTLRTQSDAINQNLGNVVFSLLGTCLLTTFIIALLIFLCVFPVTQPIVESIVALVTGIALSAIVSILLQTVLRSTLFIALFRKKPGAANIYTIFFEAWNFVNALITVIKRIALVFLQAFAFLNRIDIPFIHPDIGNDAVADNFRKEVLVHEAHSHPYIDRLCGIYLRRLRDGPLFGSRVGQVWRSAFVIGLCPWLIKYRVNLPENIEHAKTEREIANSPKNVVKNEPWEENLKE